MKVDMRVSTAKTKLMSSSVLVRVQESSNKGREPEMKLSMTLESRNPAAAPRSVVERSLRIQPAKSRLQAGSRSCYS